MSKPKEGQEFIFVDFEGKLRLGVAVLCEKCGNLGVSNDRLITSSKVPTENIYKEKIHEVYPNDDGDCLCEVCNEDAIGI